MERLISLAGYFGFLVLAWLMSSDRKRIPWRVVIGGTSLQFGLALIVLKTNAGRVAFDAIGNAFRAVLSYSDVGASIVFPDSPAGHFAFRVLPTVIFVSCLMSVLYYAGVMVPVVRFFSWIMERTLGTSGPETLSCCANIFMGQTEAPLLVRPFLRTMTRSELHAVMVGGFATIAGGVMAIYVSFGINAGHLVTASVISAPAALVISKLMCPETEPPSIALPTADSSGGAVNLFDAAATGAADGVKLAINVGAMLIAFTALIAFFNGVLKFAGSSFGQEWAIESIFSFGFAPFAWMMGIPSEDCWRSGQVLGEKVVLNEFIAYQNLSRLLASDPDALSKRTTVILTYALCGFSNFTSIGVQIGGLGSVVPERRSDIARIGLRTMIGGNLACNLTACIAGILHD
ncbi:MAG: NupC/NupG family nucleoside CNT transporter [Planctomycetes bacterium]|nr:NupC/NupG family nucleoside CNT transporter [Planctomycetota bacterium]